MNDIPIAEATGTAMVVDITSVIDEEKRKEARRLARFALRLEVETHVRRPRTGHELHYGPNAKAVSGTCFLSIVRHLATSSYDCGGEMGRAMHPQNYTGSTYG